MATFYASIYKDAKEVWLGVPEQTLKVAIGAASALTDAVAGTGRFYARITCDTACQFEHDGTATPTADGDSEYLGANAIDGITVEAGEKIAVIEQQ